MNILKSDKAPFVLVILLGAIGWLVSQLVAELRSDRSAVSYSLNQQGVEVSADIINESHDHSVDRADFALICEGGSNCLEEMRNDQGLPFYGYLQSLPPAGARFHSTGTTPSSIYTRVTLPPGGHLRIWGRVKSPEGRMDLFLTPDENHPQGVFIYDRNTVRGFLTQNLLLLLSISLIACATILVAYLWKLAALRTKVAPKE